MIFWQGFCALLFLLPACSGQERREEPQDGVVRFDLMNEQYEIKQMRFVIRPMALMSETHPTEEVIARRDDNRFAFFIIPTRQHYQQHKGMAMDPTDPPQLSLSWSLQTDSPEKLIQQKDEISLDNAKGELEEMLCSLSTFKFTAAAGVGYSHTGGSTPQECWIRVEDFANGRVTGRFGATWWIEPKTLSGDWGITGQLASVKNGTFDLPYIKSFK